MIGLPVSTQTGCSGNQFLQSETQRVSNHSSQNIGPLIADSAKLSLIYAQRMLAGVSPDQFARFASVNGMTVTSNHPAFVYGHLSLYSSRIVEQLGGDASSIKPSELYVEKFSHTATCVDDPDGSIYPPMAEITERVMTGYQLAVDTLLGTDDEKFMVPNSNEAMRAKFATNGSMHAFYLGGHFMIHMGQVSAWRRMMGLGAA